MKILTADDDALMRTFIQISLKGLEGHEAIQAADGDEALALLEEHTFDMLLLDWEMPGKSGLDIVKVIRAKGLRVPIIMVTAQNEKERVIEAIQAGVTDYLIKPFNSDLLLQKINKHRTAGLAEQG